MQQGPKKRVRPTKQAPREKKLEGKVFYLDNLKKCQTAVVCEKIHALGGKVESFLHRDVNFVVTGSKEDWESQRTGDNTGGAKKTSEDAQPQERSVSNDKLKPRPGTPRPVACGSRGKALLEKAIRNNERLGESSVLSNARSWGVKILHVDDALSYLKQLTQEALTAKQKTSDVKARTLKPPFLKIEDLSRKYKPLFMLCVSLPNLCYRSHYSPFEPPPPPPAFWDDKRTEKETNKARDNRVKSIPSDRCHTPPSFEHLPRLLRKKDGSYCEICRQPFTSMEEHLQSDQHRSFVLDHSNYTAVDRLVAEMLPGFDPNPPETGEETVNRSTILNDSALETFADAEEECTIHALLGQNSPIANHLGNGLSSFSFSPEARVPTPGLQSFAAAMDGLHANISVESPGMPVLHIQPQAQETHQQHPVIEFLPLCPSSPHPLPDLYSQPPVLSPQIRCTTEWSDPYSDPPVLSPRPFNTDETVSTFTSEDPLPRLVSVVSDIDGVKEFNRKSLLGVTGFVCTDSDLMLGPSSPLCASGQSGVLLTSKKRRRSACSEGSDNKRNRTGTCRDSPCLFSPAVEYMTSITDGVTEDHPHTVTRTHPATNGPSTPTSQSEHACVRLGTVQTSPPHTLPSAKEDSDSLSTCPDLHPSQCPSTSVCIEATLIPATASMASLSSDSDWDCELMSWLGSTSSTLQLPSEANGAINKELLHRPCTWSHDTSYESHLRTVLRPLTAAGSQCVEDKEGVSFSRTSAQIVK